MKSSNSFSRWGILCSLLIALVLSVIIFPETLPAQASGRIVGRVMDADRDEYLPGANVFLEGTSYGAATDREGEFIIYNVPSGTYTLMVSYVGYEDYSAEVTVPEDGGFVGHNVKMNVAYLQTDEIVVLGLREGQAKALNQQKTAVNIKNVVAQEQMRRFPDLNTAEVLQRVPAIAIERDQGEGRYVLVRGTEPRLNAITVNGERIASPETEERYVGLDVVSTNQVSSIEVTKTLTPDMDADAIGGAVNLITKSAFDFDLKHRSKPSFEAFGVRMKHKGDKWFAPASQDFWKCWKENKDEMKSLGWSCWNYNNVWYMAIKPIEN